MRRRPVASIIMVALLSVGLTGVPASAQPQEGDVVATGQILVGNPAFEFAGRALFGDPAAFDGLHAFTFDAAGLEGLWLWPQVHDPSGAGFVVGIHYLDQEDAFLETACSGAPGTTGLATEPYGQLGAMIQCLVPEGAVTAYVYAWVGTLLDITVVVGSPPPALPDGVLAKKTVPAGAPLAQQSLWWLNGEAAPAMFSVRANVTGMEGTRLVTDIVDTGGLGYDVRFIFRSAEGFIADADCTPMPGAAHPLETGGTEIRWSESCVVPDGAVLLDVALEHGLVVTVTLRTASG